MVRNPMNYHQISRVELAPSEIECIVFWSKNVIPFMEYLDELDKRGFLYMFQYTITPYDKLLEKNIPEKDIIIKNLQELSRRIGKKRIVWRYDPILVNDYYTVGKHLNNFREMCSQLEGMVDHIIISFVDIYRKLVKSNLKKLGIDDVNDIALNFSQIAREFGLRIKTCCEDYELIDFGIKKGACIDYSLIEKICERPLKMRRAIGQRSGCLCNDSIDIGSYNTCLNGCVYCYATERNLLSSKYALYDADSEILCDRVDLAKDTLTRRNMKILYKEGTNNERL